MTCPESVKLIPNRKSPAAGGELLKPTAAGVPVVGAMIANPLSPATLGRLLNPAARRVAPPLPKAVKLSPMRAAASGTPVYATVGVVVGRSFAQRYTVKAAGPVAR